ncbi:MAG TPA: type II toxin-antitoxin system VapC family toxin [Bryobacteraceae bacterium]|nr:type II toxin-antitoxin system VapC family toxin [Bryobacteraceae bacterium]
MLDAARESATTLYVTSQILCEFYSIVTNARRVPNPRSPDDALRAISGLLAFLHVLPIPARTVEGWLDLLRRHPVTGGDVFDLQIVATMQANGIQRIYTFNAEDFKVFPELAVLARKAPPMFLRRRCNVLTSATLPHPAQSAPFAPAHPA